MAKRPEHRAARQTEPKAAKQADQKADELVTFTITFNKPFQMNMMKGNDLAGIRVRYDDGVLAFKGTNSIRAPDAFPVVERERGGYEAVIEGSLAADLKAAFERAGGSRQMPFFTLEWGEKDWIIAKHFKKDTAPPKPVPHVRFWPPIDRTEIVREPVLSEEIVKALGDFSTRIRNAYALIAAYDSERKAGRPPEAVREAREITEAFESLAREVIPNFGVPTGEINRVVEARDLLSAFLEPILTPHPAICPSGTGESGETALAPSPGQEPEPASPPAEPSAEPPAEPPVSAADLPPEPRHVPERPVEAAPRVVAQPMRQPEPEPELELVAEGAVAADKALSDDGLVVVPDPDYVEYREWEGEVVRTADDVVDESDQPTPDDDEAQREIARQRMLLSRRRWRAPGAINKVGPRSVRGRR